MKLLVKRLISSKLGSCLFAGLWFAIAAMIPVGYYLLRFGDGLPILGGSSVLTETIPIIVSGFLGLFLGSTILDTEEIKSELQATLRGLMVGLLSYLLLFTLPAILTMFTSGDFFGTVAAFVIFFLYGLFIVGWLIAVVGALAGWLLFQLRLPAVENEK